ncbi:MAG: tetratricopeptide repeat protein [Scytolyngbya sp. HA4215-MV1]|nr:tetratricopeptide repeat protein [Scytolyngbya sp. HA4215-MV1]
MRISSKFAQTSLRRSRKAIRPNGQNLIYGQAALSHQHQQESVLHLRQRALMKAQQGHFAEAIAVFDRLITANPNSAIDYNNRGLVHFQSGQSESALLDYDRALQLNPRLANVYNNRANYYAAAGRLAEAIADYGMAIDLDPGNIRAWINQGITFRDLEMYEQAVENFDFALQFLLATTATSPLIGHLYAERGRTSHLLGDWNCAIADYCRALEKLPEAAIDSADISLRLRLQVTNWLSELIPSA